MTDNIVTLLLNSIRCLRFARVPTISPIKIKVYNIRIDINQLSGEEFTLDEADNL